MYNEKCIFLAFMLNDSAVSDYNQALANELVDRGYKVVIITPYRRVNKVSTNSNPAIYTWPSDRPTKLKDAIFLIKLINKHRPILVYSSFVATNICTLVSWLMHVPLRFVSFRTSENKYLKGKELFRQRLRRIRKILIFSLVTKVLPVSGAVAKEVESIYRVPEHKITVFQNALKDPGLYQNEKSQKKIDLVCVAGLTYGKGHDVLIKAMEIVVEKYKDVKLVLVGDGECRQSLIKMVEKLGLIKNVEFLGQLPHYQAISLVADSYAFVLATRFDAFPNVLIEALSVGTPVIASNVGGVPELIRDGIDGYLVPIEDYQLFSEAIMKLLGNSSLRDNMGANAREHYIQYFELNKAIEKQANWFENQIYHTLKQNQTV